MIDENKIHPYLSIYRGPVFILEMGGKRSINVGVTLNE